MQIKPKNITSSSSIEPPNSTSKVKLASLQVCVDKIVYMLFLLGMPYYNLSFGEIM